MLDREDVRHLLLVAAFVGGFWLLLEGSVVDAIIMFIFLGIIPGTNLALPTWLMFLFAVAGSISLLGWIRAQPFFIGNLAEQERTARQLARQRVMKKLAQPRPAEAATVPIRKAKRATS